MVVGILIGFIAGVLFAVPAKYFFNKLMDKINKKTKSNENDKN